MKLPIAVIGLAAMISTAVGQTSKPGENEAGNLGPLTGTITAELHPREPVTSLAMAVGMSDLIVEGLIVKSLPAINRTPSIPQAIETHAIVRVEKVLFGKMPPNVNTVVLAQEGGKVGQLEVLVPDDPIAKPGEEYILFLSPDRRTFPANTTGAPRYYSVGIWGGKVRIEKGKISFLPRADQHLHAHDGQSVSAFAAAIENEINHTSPTDPKLPIHPGGAFQPQN